MRACGVRRRLFYLPPNDNHPPFDVRYGEVLLGTVDNLLRGSSCWPQTLLIVTYDEHGGCFDHVIPPTAMEPGGTELRNWHPSGDKKAPSLADAPLSGRRSHEQRPEQCRSSGPPC